jgi:hypothetical protein
VIILDTNVISELMRAEPDQRVLAWARARPGTELSTTAITVAEIRCGLARLPQGRRRRTLATAADDVFKAFSGQVIPFDRRAADEYGSLVADCEHGRRPIEGFDAQIAAICRSSGADLATRNGADFGGTGLTVIDPWQA